jgi:hypothetical protein
MERIQKEKNVYGAESIQSDISAASGESNPEFLWEELPIRRARRRPDDEIPSASVTSTTALGKRSYRRIAELRDRNRNNQGESKIGTGAGEKQRR